MTKEIWKDVPGYEGLYQVSDMGRVKSLARKVERSDGRLQPIPERILSSKPGNKGYCSVCLCSRKRQHSYKEVHKLVAMAFLGHQPCGPKLVVDHKNNCKMDNHLENLQILTQRRNLIKDKRKGTSKFTGVHWSSQDQRWVSLIMIEGKTQCLGLFKEEEKAAEAYQRALSVWEDSVE